MSSVILSVGKLLYCVCSTGLAEVQIIHCPVDLHLIVFGSTDSGAHGTEADNSSGAL